MAGSQLVSDFNWNFTTTIPVTNPGRPYVVNEGKKISLNGSSSYDPEGDLLNYDWDFGDGTPHGTGESPTHTYAVSGTYRNYTVSLVVNDGISDS